MRGDVALDEAQLPEGRSYLTPAEVRRFQLALALQLELSTGRRASECLALAREVGAGHLGHTRSETSRFYIQDSAGRCPVRIDKSAKLHQPADSISAPCVLEKVGATRGKVEPVSPFCRVREDMNAADALSAHLTALRGQLGEDADS